MLAFPDPFPDPGAIDLWILRLPEDADTAEAAFESCAGFLTDGERARALRFHLPVARARHAVCRATLRRLLSAMTGIAPTELVFGEGVHGKPFLRHPDDAPKFNLSHTAGLGVIAVSRLHEIGVDAEAEARVVDALELAARVFTRSEIATLEAATGDARQHGFFRFWTAKEAVLKATGRGLSFDPRHLETRLSEEGESPGTFDSGDPCLGAANWNLHEIREVPGYRIALVAPRAVSRSEIVVHALR